MMAVTDTTPDPFIGLFEALSPAGTELLTEVLDHLPDAITTSWAIRDEAGRATDMRIAYMNGAAMRQSALDERSIGALCSAVFPGMVAAGSFAACLRVLDTGVSEAGTVLAADTGNEDVVGYGWRAVRIGTDRLVWVLRDDSPHLLALERSRRSEHAERQANVAKSDFLSRMSHELRTPLNAILGFSQLLQLDELSADQAESVGMISRAGGHLLGLINEVLDIARIESGHLDLSMKSVDVSEVVLEAMDLLTPSAKELGITLHPPSSPPALVLADRQRLLQVLLNLLSNAVKYNTPAGSVDVSWEQSGGTVSISVIDTGRGVPRDRRDQLFVPFERLGAEATSIEGTGVGLALSRGLVERMGGILYADSEERIGSTFTVELQQAAAVPSAGAATGRGSSRGRSTEVVVDVDLTEATAAPDRTVVVLYIEDDLANLRLVERVLHRRPCVKLLHAMHGRLGVDLARQHRPDLVLLDLQLPDMPGRDVLTALRSDPRTRDLRIAVVSADATSSTTAAALALGADTYLSKPFDISAVLSVVDETINRSTTP